MLFGDALTSARRKPMISRFRNAGYKKSLPTARREGE